MPSRERYLFICTNRREPGHPKGSCAESGSEDLAQAIKSALKKTNVADRIRSCTTSCLDLCEIGASIVQEPDHVAYGRVTLADVDEIVEAVSNGKVVERLVVHRKAP